VAEDSGEVRIVTKVRRNERVVATLERTLSGVSAVKQGSVAWKAPTNARGEYRHCVRASDRAGNASPVSCAKIVLR
jgi:hypothetical protein